MRYLRAKSPLQSEGPEHVSKTAALIASKCYCPLADWWTKAALAAAWEDAY